MAYQPGDLAIITTKIELAVPGGAQVIIVAPNGTKVRAQIASFAILSTEKGSRKAGDKVSKTINCKGPMSI